MKSEKKRGVSDVVATVLILLITIVAAILLGGVILTLVNNVLTTEKNTCLKIQDEITVVSKKSCYNPGNETSPTNTTVTVRFTANISEFNLYLDLVSESKVYEFKSGAVIEGVKNINSQNYGDPIILPNLNGGEKIYSFENLVAKKIKIAALTKGYVCRISEQIELEKC